MKKYLIIICLGLMATVTLNIYLIKETIHYRNCTHKMCHSLMEYETRIIEPLHKKLFPNGYDS